MSKCSNDVTNVFHVAYSSEIQHSIRLLSCVQGKMTESRHYVTVRAIRPTPIALRSTDRLQRIGCWDRGFESR